MGKVIQTTNVQAQTFGLANNVAAAYAVPQNTTCTISGLAVTSAAVTARATNDAAGMMLLASSNATFGTAGTINYAVVQSNTSGTTPVFTVDGWYTLAGVASSGTFANSGVFYILLPVAPPFWFIALTDSVSATTGSGSDASTGAALGGSELTTNGLARALADVVTRTVGSVTATMAHTFTYTTTGSQNIGRAALVNSIVGSKNYAYFVDQINSGTPAVVSANGDTLAITYTLTLG